jgi:hypothetical protein
MSPLGRPAPGRNRIAALALVALMIIGPIVWAVWSLSTASAVAATTESQKVLLAGIRQRLERQQRDPQTTGSAPDPASIHLPGDTPAIAGATLQTLVADAVANAGGRVVETEFARVEPTEEEPGRVDLRVAFDAEIVTLQKILFQLESGMPVLLVRSLSIQSPGAAAEGGDASPPLRVNLLVSGYLQAPEAGS